MLQAQLISLSHQQKNDQLYVCLMLTGLRYEEYIGTNEYFTSLFLCDQRLNSSKDRNSATDLQTFSNIGDVNHVQIGGGFFINPQKLIKN